MDNRTYGFPSTGLAYDFAALGGNDDGRATEGFDWFVLPLKATTDIYGSAS